MVGDIFCICVVLGANLGGGGDQRYPLARTKSKYLSWNANYLLETHLPNQSHLVTPRNVLCKSQSCRFKMIQRPTLTVVYGKPPWSYTHTSELLCYKLLHRTSVHSFWLDREQAGKQTSKQAPSQSANHHPKHIPYKKNATQTKRQAPPSCIFAFPPHR